MREFTKAAISYGWASTCFQVQQLTNMFATDPDTGNSAATTAYNTVAESTAAQLGPTMRATYRAGDAMQRGMVNMMFGVAGNWGSGSCDGARGERRPSRPGAAADAALEAMSAGAPSGLTGGRPAARPVWRQPRRPDLDPRRPEPVGVGDAAGPGWGPMP